MPSCDKIFYHCIAIDGGSGEEVFPPLKVVAFEFFDERTQKQRIFYSLDYEDSETNLKGTFFFEMLRDCKSFIVLSRADKINISEESSFTSVTSPTRDGPIHMQSKKMVFSQTETIFLMTPFGQIKPY